MFGDHIVVSYSVIPVIDTFASKKYSWLVGNRAFLQSRWLQKCVLFCEYLIVSSR